MVQRLMDTGKHAMALLDTLAAASEWTSPRPS
jgi:hypothetical protein